MSGSDRSPRGMAMRMAMAAAEPFYAGAMLVRNKLYDKGALKTVKLPRPVISVGNLTTGGTGKTPMIRWLANWLRDEGRRVAVLSRGYKAAEGQMGDEQIMLDHQLNGPGHSMVVVRSDPDRIAGCEAVLAKYPGINVILLDDAFQHRKVARNIDIVLLSAMDPFGFGHVLPRGMLREPIRGLRRADAIVITHCEAVRTAVIEDIEKRIRISNPKAPIYRAAHKQTGLRTADVAASAPPDRSVKDLNAHQYYAFCGIGDPRLLHRYLGAIGGNYVGHRWKPDHHIYRSRELIDIRADALARGADILITTEKDWVKLSQLPDANIGNPPIWRIEVELKFQNDGDKQLSEQIRQAIAR